VRIETTAMLSALFTAKSVGCNLSVQLAGTHTYSMLLQANHSLMLSNSTINF